MDKLRNLLFVVLFSFSLIGCTENKPKVELNERAKEVEKVLSEVSKEDCLTLYHLFSGCADYTEKYVGITKTNQINSLFRTVKERYGKPDEWLSKDGENNDISDLIEKNLKEVFGEDYTKPKDFDETNRKKFVELYRDLASGSLSSYKGKK